MALDTGVCFASVVTSFYLRIGEWPRLDEAVLWPTLCAIALVVPLCFLFGAYRAIFRYTGTESLLLMLKVLAIHGAVFSAIFLFIGIDNVPRTVGIIHPLLLLILLFASRLAASSLLGRPFGFPWQNEPRQVVMIYGAGSAGRQLANAIRMSTEMQLAGFIDDDPSLHLGVLNGVHVYDPADLQSVVAKHKVTDILLALPSASRGRRARIVKDLRRLHLHIRTLPGVIDLAKGTVSVSDLKELDIEDLLGRPTVPPNTELLNKAIANRTVLVTGAGGSIGSELCRQIAMIGPATLILVDHSEFLLYSIHQELTRTAAEAGRSNFRVVAVLASVTDPVRIDAVISSSRPDCIFHAAAYKHVPLVEDNIAEGVNNNVFGTLNVAQIAQRNGVDLVVLISTDKAVRPTNVMGASKRLSELVLQAKHHADQQSGTRFSMVRFGNVLGSSGSVVPLFRKQISAGGPVTVTHREVTRYFMTIPEAAQLVIQAGAMSTGGEVFVLDMGKPVKVMDLARNMIELSGMAVSDKERDGDIEIAIVGLRPGEKLYEELLIGADAQPTDHPRILRAHESFIEWGELEQSLARLRKAIDAGDAAQVNEILLAAIEGYQPYEGQQASVAEM
ncbi:polysaccharide biosynthesis protein [Leptolyngbya sp. 15MV]|nr:polysaccharide biosynthesis protein [Leptolyngbya sp. 15MV]